MEQKRCYSCMQLKKKHPYCEHCGYDERKKNEIHQLPAGTVLHNQYMVGRVLGQGGFGITYVGWDKLLQMPVAIKELFPSGMVTRNSQYSTVVTNTDAEKYKGLVQDIRKRFLQEARVLAQLSHVTEIVNVRYFFEENNTAYIIMEYLKGTDLKHYVENHGGRLSARETLDIMRPVIKALSVVHENNLIHRDISPDNIMMLEGGRIKLLDFGAAKTVVNPDKNNPLSQSTQTILKHGFAPIEQYQSKGNLGPWSDVHALCATIYFCLTGEVPPDAPRRIVEGTRPDWNRFHDLTDRQRRALEKGMQIRAVDRTGSMEELYNDLYAEANQNRGGSGVTEPMKLRCPVCGREMSHGLTCSRCGYDTRLRHTKHQLTAGTILSGRYSVGHALGQSSCDITYAGWDLAGDRPVAIKEFFLQGMVERDSQYGLRLAGGEPLWQSYVQKAFQNFLTSARNWAKMGTVPEFPEIYEVFEDKRLAYAVMEYIPGKSLRRYVLSQGGKLSASRALSLMEPVIRAMGEAFRMGEVHRDLNPDNIKITDDGRARIIDFSIIPDLRNPWEVRQGLKQQPSPFHPYELYTGKYSLNPAVDVYAVCAILYWCVTGQEPPDGIRQMRDHIRPEWWRISGLTEQQRQTLERGMSLTPGNRPSTMEELADGLYAEKQGHWGIAENRCPVCGREKKAGRICGHCGHDDSLQNHKRFLKTGTVLREKYRVGKVLGEGNFDITYKVWDSQRDIPVVIKELCPALMMNRTDGGNLIEEEQWAKEIAEHRLQFRQMAQGLAWQGNPRGIAAVYDYFEENNTAYMVTEYVQGRTLTQYVKDRGGKLQADDMLRILEPLVLALKNIHGANLLHRDITPDNILIESNGRAKLIDFSYSGKYWTNAQLYDSGVHPVPPFAPVESHADRTKQGPWTDVYFLCATAYFCLTGRAPKDAVRRVADRDVMNWKYIPGLTQQQEETLERGMGVYMNNRIGSMEDLYNGLFMDGYTLNPPGGKSGWPWTKH